MAAYASTITLDVPKAERISRNLGVIVGKCDVTNYNQTGAEITDITKHFKTLFRVMSEGISDNGFAVRWSTTDKCFHAFYPTNAAAAHAHDLVFKANAAANAVTMAANSLRNATGGDLTVTGGGADGGIATGGAITAAAAAEVANDVDVGEINFMAIGLV